MSARKSTLSSSKTDQDDDWTSSRGGHSFLHGHGAMGFIPNAYIIARKGPHVSVVHLYSLILLLRMLSMFIYCFLIVVLGSNPILFTSLYLGCPPWANLVHYVGIFNVFIAGSSPKGDIFFSNVIEFTESPFTL